MIHLGENSRPLVQDNFQAWDLGPVHPVLYHRTKIFGAEPVQNIFRSVSDLSEDQPETETLIQTFNTVSEFSGSRLIAITHCDYGAWIKNYIPGGNAVIPNKDIIEEYKERKRRAGKENL